MPPILRCTCIECFNIIFASFLVSVGLGFLLYPLAALFYFFMKTPKDGAQTNIYCCVAEECAGQTGLYYSDCAEKEPRPQAKDDADAKRLWELSEKLTS